jgi:arsenical pump membrane protein
VNALAATWSIAALATGGVILRPWRLPEAVWAVTGAVALVAAGLLPASAAFVGVAKGIDVYLFLTGMMLLAELARSEGLFDWLAARAVALAHGSGTRLFNLIYLVGTLVTVILSNDATAVVLTPAVAAVTRAIRVEQPLPYLLICAFIANAASFVLPISNPANLVFYGSHVPPLLEWLPRYALASVLSIGVTYLMLRWTQRRALRQSFPEQFESAPLSTEGRLTAAGILSTAVLLITVSALDKPLGLPTCLAGIATAILICLKKRAICWTVLRDISWSVLPLVAGLFVLVEAIERTGVIGALADVLRSSAEHSKVLTAMAAGSVLGFGCNLLNNLPAGLIAATVVTTAKPAPAVTGAMLVGVDLGPNLSVTGSLATILWLTALRRDELDVSAWKFLKLGLLLMPPALLLSIAGVLLAG